MRDALAIERYVERHMEPALPDCPVRAQRWHDVLVVPAYREDPLLLEHLARLQPHAGAVLVILVLNRPDTEHDTTCNQPLRDAAACLTPAVNDAPLFSLAEGVELYLHDMDGLTGPLPAREGVGLARKTGCDIALTWRLAGAIANDWLYLSDADATLPPDYFSRLDAATARTVAAAFPFHHAASGDAGLDLATALYELRLHHYVLGLEHAGSPYAMHTLGSCLAVRISGYCHVRGIPRRDGAEDFYLLNKLAKIGNIERLGGACVQLASRYSDRVPFGTGPAVADISRAREPLGEPMFYDPRCFEVLRALLAAVPGAREADWQPAAALIHGGIDAVSAAFAEEALTEMGLTQALAHCRRQGATPGAFLRHLHQWFDGFRTLKFIHALRAHRWPDVSLAELETQGPRLWPRAGYTPEALRTAVRAHWGWRN